MKARHLGLATGLAIALAAGGPAQAQFMTGPYPVIVVPPPPAQNFVLPKPRPVQQPNAAVPPPDAPPPGQVQCHYEGRTRVCN
jgi:hypothetical protein